MTRLTFGVVDCANTRGNFSACHVEKDGNLLHAFRIQL